jgi:hypothetical protein
LNKAKIIPAIEHAKAAAIKKSGVPVPLMFSCGTCSLLPKINCTPDTVDMLCPLHDILTNGRKKQSKISRNSMNENLFKLFYIFIIIKYNLILLNVKELITRETGVL